LEKTGGLEKRMKYEFWKDWRKLSNLELKGIDTLKDAKKLLLRNFPKNEIYSIYVKGSFIYRELNDKSDIDLLVILKHSKYLPMVKKLEKKYKKSFKLPIHLGAISVYELRKGKYSKFNKKPNSTTTRLAKQISSFKLAYGKEMKGEKLPNRSDMEDLKSLINAYQKNVIPLYEKGKLDFGSIIKSTFWLVENEERVKGNNPQHSWVGLTEKIKDKKHIIHQAYNFRKNHPKQRKTKLKYLEKLKDYLTMLEKRLK
jgi:predicted nucleotidyltransferase